MTKEGLEKLAIDKLWENSINNKSLIDGSQKIKDVPTELLVDNARVIAKFDYRQVKEYLLMIIEELADRLREDNGE